ncbi:MAG: MATE family efflux transporter, partial [Oscillospiraceae bacterium]|nr:MATE family efflux transporter [Oscillospiraceae bacterium]
MKKKNKTFITSKYISMLFSGTLMMVLTAVIGMIDILLAATFLGEDAAAGINLVLPIYAMGSFFAVTFSYGVPILYSKYIGAFQKEEADRCFGVGLTVISIIGILLFVLILLGGDAYLKSYQSGSQSYHYARSYLSWMKYVLLLLPYNELLDGMLFADGDETISLCSNLTQGLLKVVLSVALCRNMGTEGLALATLISFAVSTLVLCIHFFRPGNTLRPNLAFSMPVLRDILEFGIVDASMYLFVSLFTAGMNFFVIRRFGSEMLIIVSVITLIKEAQVLFDGIGEAITPLISTYLGEENYPGVRKIWKLARQSLWAESLLLTFILFVGAPLIVDFFGITDTSVAGHVVLGLRMMSLTQIFTCRLYLDSSYFILIDKISLGVLDSMRRDLLPVLPLVVLGGLIGGIRGMFFGLMIAPPLGYYLSVLYIRKKYGRENYPLFIAELEQKMSDVKLYEFSIHPEAVAAYRDEIGIALKENGYQDGQINRVMLTFEELFMLIYDY